MTQSRPGVAIHRQRIQDSLRTLLASKSVDEITIDEISPLHPERLVISPGPCTPNEAGISMAVVERFAGQIPILGICLGHQSIGQVFGGDVVRAREVMHGKTSQIHHNNHGVFNGLPQPFEATRYHSLVVARDSLPDCLEITAETDAEIDLGTREGTATSGWGFSQPWFVALFFVQAHVVTIWACSANQRLDNDPCPVGCFF